MDPEGFGELLQQTLDDGRMSRSERRALGQVLADADPDEGQRVRLRHQAFDVARQALQRGCTGHEAVQVLDWLEEAVRLVAGATPEHRPAATGLLTAYFSDTHDCSARIVSLLESTRRSLDVCVFTITDDAIAGALLAAHRRGVAVRVLTDDDKSGDLGSDVLRLARAGVPLRTDSSPHHMHHKFALFDGRRVLTGSYNWTRGAALNNQENFVVSDDPRLVRSFGAAFERLWSSE